MADTGMCVAGMSRGFVDRRKRLSTYCNALAIATTHVPAMVTARKNKANLIAKCMVTEKKLEMRLFCDTLL
jgi:pseudouridine-5'-phosphate glycosidase